MPRLKTARPWKPTLELLEDRLVPTVSVITSNFNGTPIHAGSSVWFSSVLKVSGLGAAPVTVHVSQASISSPKFFLPVPDANITFSPTATEATTTFDDATNTWDTTVPLTGLSGNVFLAGVTLPVPQGLPGGINPVTWQGDFTTDTPGVTVKWQWAAAVYTSFGSSYGDLGVKPVDDNKASQYQNSDHAGTPENFKSYVTGGARGGGGSNFTGSLSPTKAVTPGPTPPPAGPASISGYAYWDTNNDGAFDAGDVGLSGVSVTVTDADGNLVGTLSTGADGSYSFTGLVPGTYAVSEVTPGGYDDGLNLDMGSAGGSRSYDSFFGTDTISQITLGAGVAGTSYNFGNVPHINGG